MLTIEEVNRDLNEFAMLVQNQQINAFEQVKVGVDLGTANIIISILNEENKPVAGITYPTGVVRDGIVVDYVGAVEIVKKLKGEIEKQLHQVLTKAATSVPPGTSEGDQKTFRNVLEAADFEVTKIIDEPTAASDMLNVTNGAVVDVGGGTTGISILKEGKVIHSADEATGGVHMSLTLAGFYRTNYEEAEQLKKTKDKEENIFQIIRPVVEKMASIVTNQIKGYEVEDIYLVGGASTFKQFKDVFTKQVGKNIIRPAHPLYITPLGIAKNSELIRGE